MDKINTNYEVYFKFLKKYLSTGFKGINRNDQLILDIESFTETQDQFIFIGDMIQMKIIYTSDRCKQMLGIEPEELTPLHMHEATHYDDLDELGNAIANRMRVSSTLKKNKNGHSVLSRHFRMKSANGQFDKVIIQCYTFYSPFPNDKVYQLQIHTNVNKFKNVKSEKHFYIGDDLSMFRFPDKELLKIGNPFSKREFEILKYIAKGFKTEEIAKKLFLSIYTVNTHRGNILNKTDHQSIQELIAELKEKGFL